MTDERAAPPLQPLCRSAELAERGRAVLFDLVHRGEPMRGFALRIDGRVVAYLNRCAHRPVEMDWQPGDFLDALDQRWIVCSMHGAHYDAATGRCAAGPCAVGATVSHVRPSLAWRRANFRHCRFTEQ